MFQEVKCEHCGRTTASYNTISIQNKPWMKYDQSKVICNVCALGVIHEMSDIIGELLNHVNQYSIHPERLNFDQDESIFKSVRKFHHD